VTCQQVVHYFEHDRRGSNHSEMSDSCFLELEKVGDNFWISCIRSQSVLIDIFLTQARYITPQKN
jgi:hypothetical protein